MDDQDHKRPPTEHPQQMGPGSTPGASPMRSTDENAQQAPAPAREADASETAQEPPPLDAQATIEALRAELETTRSERDALAEELRQRREITARFLAALERRQRQAREQEDDPSPERPRLQ